MELQAMLIGAGVFVLSGVLIYIISALTMREKTYEEVLAEQKKKKEEIMQKSKHEKKDKTKKKKGAKAGKKEKGNEELNDAGDTAAEDEHKMVQYELEPEIIEPQEAQSVLKQRKSKKDKQKTILVNRDEKPLVKVNMSTVEHYHKPKVPLDDLELKHERQRRDSEKSHESVEHKAPQKEVFVQEQIIQQSAAPVLQTTPKKSMGDQPKKSKKKNNQDQAGGDASTSQFTELLGTVQTSQLNQYEIQALTDELLSKQAAPQQWTKNSKKGDPMMSLSKQLADQTSIVDQAKSEAQSANLKMKEFKQELFMEKQRFSMMEKQSREQIESHRAEINALHQRMQQTHEQHVAEKNSYRIQMDQIKMNEGAVSQLRDENRQLKQANQQVQAAMSTQVDVNGLKQQLKILQDELSKNVLKLNASDHAKQLLESKVSKYEGELQKLNSVQREKEAATCKLNESSDNLRRTQAKNEEMKREIEKVTSQAQRSDQEAANLRNTVKNIQESQGAVQSLQMQIKVSEQRTQEVEAKLADLEKIHRSSEQTVLTLTSEKAAMSAEVQRLKNDASSTKQTETPKVDTEALQKAEDVHKKQIESVETKWKAEIQQLTKDLAAQKEKNNALRERNWKAMDALTQAEKRAEKSLQFQDELESKDNQIVSLKEQLRGLEKNHAVMQQEKSQLSESAGKSSALWDQLQQLQSEGGDKDALISKLQTQLESANKQNQDLTANVGDQNQLQSSIQNLESKVKELQSQLQSKDVELHARGDEVDTLKKQNVNLEKQKQEVEEGQFDSEEQLHNEIKHLNAQVKQQTAQLAEANKQVEALNVNNQELQQEQFSTSSYEVFEIHAQVNILQTRLEKKSAEMAVLQQALYNREKRIQELERRTEQIHGPTYTKLLEEIREKNSEINTLQELVKSNSTDNSEISQKLESAEKVLPDTSGNTNITDELKTKSAEIEKLRAELQHTQDELSKRDNDVKAKDMQLSQLDGRLHSTQAELKETGVQLSQLHVQLERLASQETQLQQCQETVRDLEHNQSSLKESIDERISEAKDEVSNHYQELLQRLHPDIKITSSSQKEWVTIFEKQVLQKSSSDNTVSDLETQLQESSQSQSKLQAQVQHYKTVLSDTEGILNKLQSSVEAEEKKWHQKVKTSEEQLAKAVEENKRLQEEMKNGKGSKEMDDKVKDMEVKLVETASEKQHLEVTLRQELDVVSSKQEEKDKKLKELLSENVKLKANIKIGQDALNQEQDLVKQLQGQLSQSKGLANGTSSVDEAQQLRNKLIETQKQLEREADSNKQLMQKLAVSVENEKQEDGTSV